MGSETRKLSLRNAMEMCAKEFTVEYASGSEKIWVRTMTHPEYSEAQDVLAVRRQEIKRKYTPGSPQYDWMTEELSEAQPDVLAKMIVAGELQEIAKKATKQAGALEPLDLDRYSDDDARDKAQEEYDAREKAYDEGVNTIIEGLIDARVAELVALDFKELVTLAARPALTKRVSEELNELFAAYKIFACVRDVDDHSVRYFDSVDDVLSLPATLRGYLYAATDEVDGITAVDIKNSLGKSVLLTGLAENTQEVTKASSTRRSRGSGSRRKKSPGGQLQ